MKILAISGSLRKKSYNSAIIRALREIDTNIDIYKDLGKLPFFNPDINNHTLEEDSSPILVRELREIIASVDAIVISTPEYAFEIPGVLKNANVVLMNLIEVLTGDISKQLTLTIPMVNKKINTKGQIFDKRLIAELNTLLDTLKLKIRKENYV